MVGHIGRYRIESKLGEGGMGAVYKARDTRLDRSVALKVLPTGALANPERTARFEQEAKAASLLNHPNIVHVYDIDTVEGVTFIAMEYVAGKSLAELIGRKGLGVAAALQYAVPIAGALAAAHAAGIVHRDIKPGNVMVSENGLVKILDFGLAKLSEPVVSGDFASTQTIRPRTEEGAIVGTVAYMSPEQVEAKPVNARSDIFSFGSMLYEMLTGRRPFQGESNISTLAAILHQEPKPASEFVPEIPRDLEQIVVRCLRKDPQRRIQVMDDVKLLLEEVKPGPIAAGPTAAQRNRAQSILLAGAAPALILVLAVWLLAQGASDVPSYRFRPFATEAVDETSPAWSPDGKTVAYLAGAQGARQVFTRALGSPIPVQITKSRVDCDSLFWHPGGARLYYTSEHRLWSVGAAGGEPEVVVDDTLAATISPDGKTFALIRGGDGPSLTLWITPTREIKPERYRQAPLPETFREQSLVSFSPDGSKIGIVLSVEAGGGGYEFWTIPFPSGKPRLAISSSAHAVVSGMSWMPDSRHVIFGAVLPSNSGSHLYSADTGKGAILPATSGTGEESDPSVSPDGNGIAFTSGGTDFDLIESPLDGGPLRTLLATSRDERTPSWSPSGSQYAYTTNANGTIEIWLRSLAEGWARPVVVAGAEGLPEWHHLWRPHFSPDGTKIVYLVLGLHHSVWVSPIAGGRPIRLDTESLDQHGPAWSPDGNWISYWRLQAGKWAIVKAPLGGGKPITLLETSFGYETVWSPSGEWICYSNSDGLQIVSSDGRTNRLMTKTNSSDFGFSRDGSTVYVLRRGDHRWEVASIDVRTGIETKASQLVIPPNTVVAGFSLNPSGKSFATSIGTSKHDIWLLEDFRLPGRRWLFGIR
jgi:Tol biopolymer transport system component